MWCVKKLKTICFDIVEMTSHIAAYSNAYLNTITELQDFLLEKCPEFQAEIELAKMYVVTLKNISITKLIGTFHSNLKPYQNQIENCDEVFFMDHENVRLHDVEAFPLESPEIWDMLIDCWKSDHITEIDQAKIWHYVQRLVKLGNMLNF